MPLLHIPYRGVAPAVLAVTRGEVDLYCSRRPWRADAAARRQGHGARHHQPHARRRRFPTVPSFAELGLPNYSQTGYVGIMATGGTPTAVIDKLNASINAAIHDPVFAKKFAAFGYDMNGGTATEFGVFLKDDIDRYRKLAAAAGIEPQ